MPQARNKNVNVLNMHGKGSTLSSLTDLSFFTRKRAEKLNQIEIHRLGMHVEFILKNVRYQENERDRVKDRLLKSLENMQAYRELLSTEFKVDNFDTMKLGYRAKDVLKDPSKIQRYSYETKIYNSGFSMKTLHREMQKKREALKPEVQRAEAKQQLIEKMKVANKVEIFDRRRSLTMILEDHKKKNKANTGLVLSRPHLKPVGWIPESQNRNGHISQELYTINERNPDKLQDINCEKLDFPDHDNENEGDINCDNTDQLHGNGTNHDDHDRQSSRS